MYKIGILYEWPLLVNQLIYYASFIVIMILFKKMKFKYFLDIFKWKRSFKYKSYSFVKKCVHIKKRKKSLEMALAKDWQHN